MGVLGRGNWADSMSVGSPLWQQQQQQQQQQPGAALVQGRTSQTPIADTAKQVAGSGQPVEMPAGLTERAAPVSLEDWMAGAYNDTPLAQPGMDQFYDNWAQEYVRAGTPGRQALLESHGLGKGGYADQRLQGYWTAEPNVAPIGGGAQGTVGDPNDAYAAWFNSLAGVDPMTLPGAPEWFRYLRLYEDPRKRFGGGYGNAGGAAGEAGQGSTSSGAGGQSSGGSGSNADGSNSF